MHKILEFVSQQFHKIDKIKKLKNMKNVLTLLIFITLSLVSCKNKAEDVFKKHTKDNYSIEYPESWDLDTSGQYNTQFLIFSNTGIIDTFRENVNLTIENLPSNVTLTQYAEAAKQQIAPIPKVKTISSNIIQINGNEVFEIVWQGYVNNADLKFKQQCRIKDNKAYIVTFTAKQTTYDTYIDTAEKILNSFTLN